MPNLHPAGRTRSSVLSVLVAVGCLAALLTGPVGARTIRVPSGDAPTIQAGVDAAAPGDVVLLAPGVHSGAGSTDVLVPAVGITIRGEGGAERCVIDGGGEARAFVIGGGEIGGGEIGGGEIGGGEIGKAVIEGITIRDCRGGVLDPEDADGGAILARSGGLTLRDCVLRENSAAGRGGAVFADGDVLIERCIFLANEAGMGGALGGVLRGRAVSCVLAGNTAARSGGAIWSEGDMELVHVTLAGNAALDGGGGGVAGKAVVRSSILWGNTATSPADEATSDPATFAQLDGGATASWSCIEGWVDPQDGGSSGNTGADPLFVDAAGDAAGGDYRLQAGSPCIDAAAGDTGTDSGAPPRDVRGVSRTCGLGPDIGAHERCEAIYRAVTGGERVVITLETTIPVRGGALPRRAGRGGAVEEPEAIAAGSALGPAPYALIERCAPLFDLPGEAAPAGACIIGWVSGGDPFSDPPSFEDVVLEPGTHELVVIDVARVAGGDPAAALDEVVEVEFLADLRSGPAAPPQGNIVTGADGTTIGAGTIDALLRPCLAPADGSGDCDGNGTLDRCELAAGTAADTDGNGVPDRCDPPRASGGQKPGDCNQDGKVDISDALCTLGFLFLGSPVALPCGDGTAGDRANIEFLDVSRDGAIDISDPVLVLNWLFLGLRWPFLEIDCISTEGCAGTCGVPDHRPIDGFTFMGFNSQGRAEYLDEETRVIFVLLPGGTFTMGSPGSEAGRDADEHLHDVQLTPFLIARGEITQEEWLTVARRSDSPPNGNPSHSGDLRRPVEQVTWEEARAYCEAAGYRLPTEAQWEYACRAGSNGPRPPGVPLDSIAWWKGNSGGTTHAGEQKTPNAFGLLDMHGNVAEWCADMYSPTFGPGGPPPPPGAGEIAVDPLNEAGALRVYRGCSYRDEESECRAASRHSADPGNRFAYLGLRPVVWPLPGTTAEED